MLKVPEEQPHRKSVQWIGHEFDPNNNTQNNDKDSKRGSVSSSRRGSRLSRRGSLPAIEAKADVYHCGFSFYEPLWLRRFGATKYFVMIYALLAVLMGMEYSYKSGTILTLQRRFKINDKITGIVFLANEVSQILFSIILAYVSVTGKCNRPRWMAIGIFLAGLGAFLMATPHFIYGDEAHAPVQYQYGVESPVLAGRHAPPRVLSHGLNSPAENASRAVAAYDPVYKLCTASPSPSTQPPRYDLFNNLKDKNILMMRDDEDDSSENGSEEEEVPIATCDYGPASVLTMIFIVISESFVGVSALVIAGLGSPYLEESLVKTKSASIFGITMSLKVIGPILGYRLAAACLKIYTAPLEIVESTSQEEGNANNVDYYDRIGAWWLGWILLGIMLLIASFLMSLFPKYLPKPKKYRYRLAGITINNLGGLDYTSKTAENQDDKGQVSVVNVKSGRSLSLIAIPEFVNAAMIPTEPTFRDNLKKLGHELKLLMKNKINVANNLATLFYTFALTGYWTYMPNYIESAFMKTAYDATFISDNVVGGSQAVGLLLCGYLISKYQPSARFLAGWNVFIGLLYVAVKISFTQMSCTPGNYNFLGNSEPGSGSGSGSGSGFEDPQTSCSSNCACDTNTMDYTPVCDRSTNQVYFSPCHAGCTSYRNGVFGNCSCILPGVQLETGNCIQDGCSTLLILFLSLNGLLTFLEACGKIGNVLVSYRCVHPKKKGFSICVNMGLACVFSYVPAPYVFKYIFDNLCLVWGTAADPGCSTLGMCWLYDVDKLRYVYNLTAAFFFLLSTFFDAVTWYYVKNLDLYDDYKNIERWESKKQQKAIDK